MEDTDHSNANVSASALSFDKATERQFVAWFQGLPKNAQLLRFFAQTGQIPFFTCYGENALLVARQFYRTMAVVKYLGGSEGLPYVNLNRSLYETVLRELLVEGANCEVEVYEGTGATWRMARRASPGRLGSLEDDVFRTVEMTEAPVVMAITLGACRSIDR